MVNSRESIKILWLANLIMVTKWNTPPYPYTLTFYAMLRDVLNDGAAFQNDIN